MKVLITAQFNTAMRALEQAEQREVASLYDMLSAMTADQVSGSPLITRLNTGASEIYTVRGQHVRVFMSFGPGNELIFVDVKAVKSDIFCTPHEDGREITIFGSNGDPRAYVATGDSNTIYTFVGEPLAYIDEQKNIYGFNGRHLGWMEDGIVWNHQGRRVGFVKEKCPVFTRFEPFKGFKQFKPFKGFKQFAPFKPFKSATNSSEDLVAFLKQGRA